jgi:hypothetical protein
LIIQHDTARQSTTRAEARCRLGGALAALGRADEAREAWLTALSPFLTGSATIKPPRCAAGSRMLAKTERPPAPGSDIAVDVHIRRVFLRTWLHRTSVLAGPDRGAQLAEAVRARWS